MTEREQNLVEAVKKVLQVKSIHMLLPESALTLYVALKAYADCPPCCLSPELCAGTGRCPRGLRCSLYFIAPHGLAETSRIRAIVHIERSI